MTSIPFSSIIEGDRGRSQKNYGNLDGLISSLRSVGSIHPITLSRTTPDRDEYVLVAGGRRYAAMKSMGITELFHSSVLDPQRLGFVFADEVPEDVLREAELDENLHRLDCTWVDNVLMICNVHRLKSARSLKWGAAQTSAMMGQGFGLTKVSYAVAIGPLLRKGDKELLACPSFSAAISVMVKRGEDAALAEMQRRNAVKVGTNPIVKIDLGSGTTGSFLDTLNTSLGPKIDFTKGGDALCALNQTSTAQQRMSLLAGTNTVPSTEMQSGCASNGAQQSNPVVAPVTSLPLSSMFRLGDSLLGSSPIMLSFPDASFDHIVSDIPYGIDMDNLNVKGKADIVEQHEVEANKELMPLFLEQAFRLTKPRGFCVFFMDLDHWNFLQHTAKLIGWKVQDWPLVWIKIHNCQNQGAAYNYTKTYECAMVLRRDSETVLRKQRPNAHWIGDGAAERKLYNNPFAKPFLLWKELIFDNIAFPGQSVYDPFAGECSGLSAAVNCGLIPFGSEISEVHFNRGTERLKSVYALLHSSNIAFT